MSNIGRFVDRSPHIRTAGLVSSSSEQIIDSLKYYPQHEFLENFYRNDCRQKLRLKQINSGPIFPFMPAESELKVILSPDLQKSRFERFQEKFSEQLFCKKPELGKASPYVKSKPAHITNENTCFGDPTCRDSRETVYEVIMPKKSADQVNADYVRGHRQYVVSHQHYLPGEQINRSYKPPFDRDAIYGIKTPMDNMGRSVKRALEQCSKQRFLSERGNFFYHRAMGELGGKVLRYHDPPPSGKSLEQRRRGRLEADECNARALIENIPHCGDSDNIGKAIGYLQKLRTYFYKKYGFYCEDVDEALRAEDKQETGRLPLKTVFRTARKMQVHFDEEKMRIALHVFGLIDKVDACDDAPIDYVRFVNLITYRKPLPAVDIARRPCGNLEHTTTYRLLCQDLKKPRCSTEVHIPEAKESIKDAIAPSIPTQYGLEPKDFAEKRTKEELMRIFRNLMSAEMFVKIWEDAKNKLQASDCLLSVQDIRQEFDASRQEIASSK